MIKESTILLVLLWGMSLFFIAKDVQAIICMSDGECDDGDICTEDWCDKPQFGFGTCKHNPVDCDDGIYCTVDGCDPIWGCFHNEDDDYCYDGNPCTGDRCKEGEGCVYEIYYTHPCDDGLYCNGIDSCDEDGICSVHSGDPCSLGTFCNELTDSCDSTPPETSTTTTSTQTTSITTSIIQSSTSTTSVQPSTSTTSQLSTDTYSVSGYMIGDITENVTIKLSGAASRDTLTDIHGYYELSDLYSGYYTITPKMVGYNFEPPSYVIQNLTSNLYDMDFISTKQPCFIELLYCEDSQETALMSYVRDTILSETPEGQEIIRLYYEWNPAIVKAMEEDEEFKAEVKEMVDGVLELIEGESE